MKRLFLFMIFIIGCSGGGGSKAPESTPADIYAFSIQDEFKAWIEFDRPAYDTNKSGGDSNMCYAATAANLIAWTNNVKPEPIYADFVSYFNNEYYGIGIFGALTYYYGYDEAAGSTLKEVHAEFVVDFIKSSLHDGLGTAIQIAKDNSHTLSVYGYKQVSPGKIGLYYTDPDYGSGIDLLIFVLENGKWTCQTAVYRNWFISYGLSHW